MMGGGCEDNSCEILVSPLPTKRPARLPVLVRPHKRRVLFVDSRKPGSSEICRRAIRILENRGIDARIVFEKRTASLPMNDVELSQLTSEEGLVLCGVAD